jgi:uncharacterized protein
VLVAHGANVNHVDARGGTALQMAIAQRNPAAEDALRQVGATQRNAWLSPADPVRSR